MGCGLKRVPDNPPVEEIGLASSVISGYKFFSDSETEGLHESGELTSNADRTINPLFSSAGRFERLPKGLPRMIKTKSIYDPKSADDGLRVLVTRYWPRGVKKEAVDIWVKGLGPAPALIRLWKGGDIPWSEFKRSYKSEYGAQEKKKAP